MAGVQSLADRVHELEYELGQTKIQLEHKTTLLASCEKALEERDAKFYAELQNAEIEKELKEEESR